MNYVKKINLLFVGSVRDEIEFLSLIRSLREEDKNQYIESISLLTWTHEKFNLITEADFDLLKIRLIRINLRFRDLSPFSTFRIQKRLLRNGLGYFLDSDVVLKSRMDVSFNFNLCEFIVNSKEILNGNLIWVPNYSYEYPAIVADHTYCGQKRLLNDLYVPVRNGVNRRSGNGTKIHIDTFSSYLDKKCPNHLKGMNLIGSLISKNYLNAPFQINRDLARPDLKSLLWKTRFEVIISNSKFISLLVMINDEMKSAILVGMPGQVTDVAYISRQGENFHGLNRNFSKGLGHALTFDSSAKENSLSGIGLKNFSIEAINKNDIKELRKNISNIFLQRSELPKIMFHFHPDLNWKSFLVSFKNYFKSLVKLFLEKCSRLIS